MQALMPLLIIYTEDYRLVINIFYRKNNVSFHMRIARPADNNYPKLITRQHPAGLMIMMRIESILNICNQFLSRQSRKWNR